MLANAQMWTLITDAGPLDISFLPEGTDGYRDLARNRVVIDLDGTRAPVASVEDIVRSKRAAGRQKDLEALPTLLEWLRRAAG